MEKNKPLVISVENLQVKYRIIQDRPGSLKEYLIRAANRDLEVREFEAIKNLSFNVHKGEAFGVIGRNGAGKSTLLRVLSKIMRPTSGRVRIVGDVVSLLGVGAGFQPELSGMENVYMYSALFGRSRAETDALIDEIVEFSELGDFINSPVRTYSSGMTARLGFSTAMVNRPDILLLDEVLAVGDESFKEKCVAKFDEYKERGMTVVIVSHSTSTINSICDNVAWVHEGEVVKIGQPEVVTEEYVKFLKEYKKNVRSFRR